MSSSTTAVGTRPGTSTGTQDLVAELRHSKSCPARQIGGACEPWCHAYPCPRWCTGAHRSGNRLYHLAAPCPPWCAGHPNGETDYEFSHDGRRPGMMLSLIVKIKGVRG